MNTLLRRQTCLCTLLSLMFAVASSARADDLASGVRGVATRAPGTVKIDGNLEEFRGAFCTPVNYFHPQAVNRAAQFYYMWDDEAFYAGLRTLDGHEANFSPDDKLWGGDAVEWYFDTRRDENFRAKNWGPGSVHMYWTAYDKAEMKPRWCLRPDMLQVIVGTGVEVAARKTSYGAETEFKLPWANFPNFQVSAGAVIALDAELCYSDGGPRVDRTFAYGSPLSVQQPASQAKVQLVDKLEPGHWKQCGPVMMPLRCDTPWNQPTRALVTCQMAIPPNHANQVGKIVFRISDTQGVKLHEYEAKIETINADGSFQRAAAIWPTDEAIPGGHILLGIVYDRSGGELTRVAPRLVGVGNKQGY